MREQMTPRPAPWRWSALAFAVVAALTVAGCSSGGGSTPIAVVGTTADPGGYRGASLPEPEQLSAAARTATFRSSRGGTTTLGNLQQGRLMLVFFGYTNCPDECPTTMADLAQALRQQPPLTQSHTQVVFVTSDPDRDTPAAMASWLSNFDEGLLLPFVGLTASVEQIDSIAASIGVPLAPPVRQKDGTIEVQHGTQTLAFVGGKASVAWVGGTSAADIAHDIGLLIPRVTDAP